MGSHDVTNDARINWVSRGEEATIELGRRLGCLLQPGDVVALHGPLGAGKTRFVRGVAAGMGIDDAGVSSPTYVLANEYERADGDDGPPLIHMDAYRLDGAGDLDSLGWDVISDGSAVVIIEWAERVSEELEGHPSLADVRLDHADGHDLRMIEIRVPGTWVDRPAWAGVIALTGARPPKGWSRCPVTGRPVHPAAPSFPFADDRARLADLDRWLTGSYRISREAGFDDFDAFDDAGEEEA